MPSDAPGCIPSRPGNRAGLLGLWAPFPHRILYAHGPRPYTSSVNRLLSEPRFRRAALAACAGALFSAALAAQETTPAEPKTAAAKDFPAQIELLETRWRFGSGGDSEKEVHAVVRINSELGARQFARLNFDYHRAFQQVAIPFVRITHASGGTVDMLPSAVSDVVNPAVAGFPAFADVRIKSARILGLGPGDKLEYRVVTKVSGHPLAPDFWLEHSFDRTGLVSREIFELVLPSSRDVQMRINPDTPAAKIESSGDAAAPEKIYRWQFSSTGPDGKPPEARTSDLVVTTFASWETLGDRLARLLEAHGPPGAAFEAKAREIPAGAREPQDQLRAFYQFVSTAIRTVDVPLDATGYRVRPVDEILASGYATALEKYALLRDFRQRGEERPAFCAVLFDSRERPVKEALPVPVWFDQVLVYDRESADRTLRWLDPTVEVAPLGMVPSTYRGKSGLLLARSDSAAKAALWPSVPRELPFPSFQHVSVDGALGADGKLTARVKYTLRGDNELLLRVAFHRSPKDKWKEVAQLLALSDGFRGQIVSAAASDPLATDGPLSVEYEIAWPGFVDWSKSPVRIPVLLPQISLPELPAKSAAGATIELGTPLEVETRATLALPPGATPSAPPGTSVARDYAQFSSTYSARGATVTATRKIHFLLWEIPTARAADYGAFLHAVQTDQTQAFAALPAGKTAP